MKTRWLALFLVGLGIALANRARAQAPGVPVVHQGQGSVPEPELVEQAKGLRDASWLLSLEDVRAQKGRSSCSLTLPPPQDRSLSGSQLWNVARQAHVRLGYLYWCSKCKKLHLNLAGGYALTTNGAVATCYHVVVEPSYCSQGHLVAVTEAGKVVPVAEVLACDKAADTCIVRIRSTISLEPLPLSTNVAPGDSVWCYSDPGRHSGYFSQGIVNRFYQNWDAATGAPLSARRMNVSTDWAAGSSGSAVLDRSGNAVGHVARINAQGADLPSENAASTNHNVQTVIVYHEATCAAEVLALVKR